MFLHISRALFPISMKSWNHSPGQNFSRELYETSRFTHGDEMPWENFHHCSPSRQRSISQGWFTVQRVGNRMRHLSWWRHQMETFSALLALYAGDSPVTGEFPVQRPVTRSFDVSLICAWINGWVNNRKSGDLRRHRAHYDVIVLRPEQNGAIV